MYPRFTAGFAAWFRQCGASQQQADRGTDQPGYCLGRAERDLQADNVPGFQSVSRVAVALSQSADDGGRAHWIADAPDTHAHYVTVNFAQGDSEKTLTVPIRSDGRDTSTLTVAAMSPCAGDSVHPGSVDPFTACGQKVAASVRILDTTADGNPLRRAVPPSRRP